VKIPDDAEAGQYIAGIALQTADSLPVEGTDLFNQIIRKSIAVFITVPGTETPGFELDAPVLSTDGAFDAITVPVTNTGNVLVRPAGDLTIVTSNGETVVTAPIAMGSIYAGTTVPLSVPLTDPLPEGDYTVAISLNDPETGIAVTSEGVVTISNIDQVPAQFEMMGTVSLSPDATNPAFADVAVTVANGGQAVSDAEVLLDVSRDGELVEMFSQGSSLALPQGETSLSQRYIPPTGWEAGIWNFSLRLNVTDPSSGASTTVAVFDDIATVEIGA
jgi:hypothetical protein